MTSGSSAVMTAAMRRRGRSGVLMGAALRVLLIALLFLVVTDVHVRCITTAYAQAPGTDPEQAAGENLTIFEQFEADALNAVRENWTSGGLNKQLSSILDWSPQQHPCNRSNKTDSYDDTVYEGAWRGVYCTSLMLGSNSTVNLYHVSVMALTLFGSNMSCDSDSSEQCGFEGIQGVLPPEIGNLTNLRILYIRHHPKLTGEVPLQIWQLPELISLDIGDNRLSGPFPKEIFMLPKLSTLTLSGNQFNGSFPTNLVTNLSYVDVSRNNFSGSLDFQHISSIEYNGSQSLNFSNNCFSGRFSSGKYLNARVLDLSYNYFIDIFFDTYGESRVYMPNLRSLYIQHNQGPFDKLLNEILEAPNLRILNIQNNNFGGKFPSQLLKASLLEALYADENSFSSLEFPEIDFENFNLVRIGLFLTNNSIGNMNYASKGPYTKENLRISNYIFLAGNPCCSSIDSLVLSVVCRTNRYVNQLPFKGVQTLSIKLKAIIATSTSTFGLILFIISIYVWRLMRKIQFLGMILREFSKREVKPNLFSYKDIKLATNNFDKRNKLGEGGFGVVYKGILSDGTIVAVKKLTMSSNQIFPEFLNEVAVISGLIHRNLVKFKGCCLGDGHQYILIFEYVENKNLAEALLLSDNEEKYEPIYLDWARRFNIIIGIARGISYLHEDLQSPVIHRDIKATNILLDKDYNPKIADFGLAYLFPTLKNDETHLTMVQVVGTRGYCAPEYIIHGHMSTALDVYSFGILILEIVSGRKNIDLQRIEEEINLHDWAWELFEAQNLIALIDQQMEYLSLDVEAITRVINVALACVQFKAATRPKMHEVVHMLLGNVRVVEIHECLGGIGSSSSWESNNASIDDLSLLSNSHEIEISKRS